MYTFTDTTQLPKSTRPSEALKLNGAYIEDQIPGYRTLYVSGRESLSPELSISEMQGRDGARRTGRRYPQRTIVVGYQLIVQSSGAFRDAYNKLGEILDVEDAELIFDDEPDKFYTGSVSALSEIEPGRNAVKGEIEFTCLDPLKYSVEEFEVIPDSSSPLNVTIDYGGTYKSYPTLVTEFYKEEESDGDTQNTITGNGDCGYVAFFDDDNHILQFGNPDEVDGETLEKSQTLVNQTFSKSTSWGSAAQQNWILNKGVVSSSSFVQAGTMKAVQSYSGAATYYLTPSGFGSGNEWHGPSITREIPADASGNVGAVNFVLSYAQKMSIGNASSDISQIGAFQCILSDAFGKIVCGITIFKNKSGKSGIVRFYVGGKSVLDSGINLSYDNKYFGNNTSRTQSVKTSSISKFEDTVKFNVGGMVKTFRDKSIKDSAVTKITFSIVKYGTRTALSYNGLYWVKFVKSNCDTWKNIPNKFSANDILSVDCRIGDVTLNDSPAPELGALGNDWEDFCLTPGQNNIGMSCSEWIPDGYRPTFKVQYREAYL